MLRPARVAVRPFSLAAVVVSLAFAIALAPFADAQTRPAGGRGFRPSPGVGRGGPHATGGDSSGKSGGSARRPADRDAAPGTTKKPKDEAGSEGGVTPSPGSTGDFDWELWWYHNLDRYLTFAPASSGGESGRSDADAAWNERRREIADVLREAVHESDVRVQQAAIVALGKAAGGDDDVAFLDGLLREATHKNRVAAVIALGHTRRPEAVDRLLRLLADAETHAEVRAAAALSLGLLGEERSMPALVAAARAEAGATDLLVASYLGIGLAGGEAAVPFLASALADEKAPPLARSYAALALGKTGVPAAEKPLEKALEAADADVRCSAIIALGALGLASRPGEAAGGGKPFAPARDQASLALARLLDKDPSFAARCLACFSLAQLNGSGARSALQRAAKGGDPDLRCAALLALGLTGEASAVAAIRPYVKDRSGDGAIGAAAALGMSLVGDAKEAPAVLAAFKAEDRSDPRAYLALALGLLRSAEAVPVLSLYAKGTANPPLARASLFALAVQGEKASRDLLRAHASQSEDPTLSVEAVRVIGEAADPADIPLLVSVLRRDGSSWNERYAAVQALGRMSETGRVAPLARVFESNNYFLEVRLLENVFESL